MAMRLNRTTLRVGAVVVAVSALAVSFGLVSASGGGVTYGVGRIIDVSVGCPGTGDSSAAVDARRDEVFQAFEGCDGDDGIGFVRSGDGGAVYTKPVTLPGSNGGWDPWLAVAPDGTLYAAFMNTIGTRTYPVIDVSHSGGRSFRVERSLRPRQRNNWGDADYLAVGTHGALYVAWDYGPSNGAVATKCSATASCWATRGDLNVVVQRSLDQARRFSKMVAVSPGYPEGGADEGAVVVAPSGAVDVLYQGYRVVNRHTLQLGDGHEYFTTSRDGGMRWSKPMSVGARAGAITVNEWWNDGSISVGPDGALYASWDTQSGLGRRREDLGWLSFSTDGGRHWSYPLRATPDRKDVPHILEVVGIGHETAIAAWLSRSDPRGYALYLRPFRADKGGGRFVSRAYRVSPFGSPGGFPGDTFGLALLRHDRLVLCWGAAMRGDDGNSMLYTTTVRVTSG